MDPALRTERSLTRGARSAATASTPAVRAAVWASPAPANVRSRGRRGTRSRSSSTSSPRPSPKRPPLACQSFPFIVALPYTDDEAEASGQAAFDDRVRPGRGHLRPARGRRDAAPRVRCLSSTCTPTMTFPPLQCRRRRAPARPAPGHRPGRGLDPGEEVGRPPDSFGLVQRGPARPALPPLPSSATRSGAIRVEGRKRRDRVGREGERRMLARRRLRSCILTPTSHRPLDLVTSRLARDLLRASPTLPPSQRPGIRDDEWLQCDCWACYLLLLLVPRHHSGTVLTDIETCRCFANETECEGTEVRPFQRLLLIRSLSILAASST